MVGAGIATMHVRNRFHGDGSTGSARPTIARLTRRDRAQAYSTDRRAWRAASRPARMKSGQSRALKNCR